MSEIKVGDTVRWRRGGKRNAIVVYVSEATFGRDKLVRLDRQLRGSTLHYVDDLAVVKSTKENE